VTRAAFTRREVLGAGLGIAGSALALVTIGSGLLYRSKQGSYLVETTYRPLVGSVFNVEAPGGSVGLTLAGTRSLGPLRYGESLIFGKENFALDFKGRPGIVSGTHVLTHPALGQFQLFINPVGQPGSIQRYEAIINTYEINSGRSFDV
jgi:Domain of unknown function (DUF6916)